MKTAQTDESQAFFYKMIGDYYRYMSECAQGDRLEQIKGSALQNYNLATQKSESLNPCNAIRLGLALNFSVFQYELMQDKNSSIELGEKALSEALDKIDDVDEETFRDAKSIIELLKENLQLWKEDLNQNDNVVEDL